MSNIPVPVLLAPVILLVVGWFCLKKPTIVVRLLTAHLDVTNQGGQLTKGQKIAKYVREYPGQWQQQYPDLFGLIRLIGVAAYVMFVLGLAIIFLSQLQIQ